MVQTTQGVKFGRDQLYFLCVSRQNAYITNEQYITLFQNIIDQSAKLVAAGNSHIAQRRCCRTAAYAGLPEDVAGNR